MTHQELAWWLRDHQEEHREFTYTDNDDIFDGHIYNGEEANKPVEDILIRENGGEWQEPLIEI